MRLHVVTFLRPGPEAPGRSLDRILEYGRQVERRGLPGLWVTDAFGRGWPSLDPLVALGALAAATKTVELGTCVLQVPVRHPVELAHRIQSVQALSGDRLRMGVGCGSTKAEFDLVGGDYDARFKTLMTNIEIMRHAWRGDPVAGGALTPWPGCEGGPQLMLGAWRNKRWIVYAAEQCDGWIGSGLYGTWEDLAAGTRRYREAGGKRAILANVITDLHNRPEIAERAQRATITLACDEAEARRRLQRLKEIGLDDVLCMASLETLDDVERLRDLA